MSSKSNDFTYGIQLLPMNRVPRIRTIELSGYLAERFGKSFRLAVETPAEAIKALSVLCKGFRKALNDGEYRIVRIKKLGEYDTPLGGIHMTLGKSDIRFVPVMAGAKSGAWLVLAGIAIVAAAFVFAPAGAGMFFGGGLLPDMGAAAFSMGGLASISYGNIAMIGVMTALLGVSQLLSPKPADATTSIAGNTFSSLKNVDAQGIPVPLLYGESLEGSIRVSAGMFAVQVSVGAAPHEGHPILIVGS